MEFRFAESHGIELVKKLAETLHYYEFGAVLSGPYTMSNYHSDVIDSVLELLSPDNMVIFIVSKIFAGSTNRREPWYGTEFSSVLIEELDLHRFREATPNDLLFQFQFLDPPINEFIPRDFALYNSERERGLFRPEIIYNDKFSTIWLVRDCEYFLPKTYVKFRFRTPLAYSTAENTVMAYLLVQMVKDELTNIEELASAAQLQFELTNGKDGIYLKFWGITEKQHLLMTKVAEAMVNFQPNEEALAFRKDDYLASLRSITFNNPFQTAVYHLNELISKQRWTAKELHAAVEGTIFLIVAECIS